MKHSRNTILLGLSVLIVLGGGFYYFFFYNNGTDQGISASSTGIDATEANVAEMSFIALVGKLDPIVFNTQVLTDPRFTTKQDIKTAIVPETTGRKDPFAPIGSSK